MGPKFGRDGVFFSFFESLIEFFACSSLFARSLVLPWIIVFNSCLRIEASKVSPSCLSKFASFFFCHPHATKEKTCLKKILNLQWQQWSIFVLLRKFDVGLFLPDWTNYISKQMKLYDFNFYGLWLGFIPSRHDFLESLSNFFSPPVNKVDLNNGVTSSTTEHQSIYRFQKIEHRGSSWWQTSKCNPNTSKM